MSAKVNAKIYAQIHKFEQGELTAGELITNTMSVMEKIPEDQVTALIEALQTVLITIEPSVNDLEKVAFMSEYAD